MTTTHTPCPICGSNNVRWRKRRWYDGPLNFFETMLSGATRIQTDDGVPPILRAEMDAGHMRDRDITEHGMSANRAVAPMFWRCPDCHQHGEGYDEPPRATSADNYNWPR